MRAEDEYYEYGPTESELAEEEWRQEQEQIAQETYRRTLRDHRELTLVDEMAKLEVTGDSPVTN